MPARGWSTTSSTTSTSSSTSELAPGPPTGRARILGLIRLGHPFPSLLNAIVTAGLVLVAGGPWGTALRLGLAMLCIQLSIGAFNDLSDAEADAQSSRSKPIPAGAARTSEARLLTVGGLGAGLALSLPSGPVVVALALAGAACGYVYDAWLKPTALSWLPLAIALPLLPIYAWLGAGASVPSAFATLVPLAILAGGALAISNALIDLELDRAAGLATIVTRLGRERSWWLHAALLASVVIVAAGAWWVTSVSGAEYGPTDLVGGAAFSAGAVLTALGVGLTWRRTRAGGAVAPGRADGLTSLAWEIEAVGVGLMGFGWLSAVARPAG